MTKSTITRERLEQLADNNTICKVSWDERIELAQIALAAMDSKPVFFIEVEGDDWINAGRIEGKNRQDLGLLPDGINYLYGAPQPLTDAEREELQELRKADSESVAEVLSNRPGNDTSTIDRALPVGTQLYRHAQQPVVPDDVLDALQKVARLRLDLNDFDGDRRGIADCLCDAEEALIEVVNCCAAMLAAAPQEGK